MQRKKMKKETYDETLDGTCYGLAGRAGVEVE